MLKVPETLFWPAFQIRSKLSYNELKIATFLPDRQPRKGHGDNQKPVFYEQVQANRIHQSRLWEVPPEPLPEASTSVRPPVPRTNCFFITIRSGHKLIFFCFLFIKNQWPLVRKHFSLPFFLATPSSPSRTFEGLFELTRCPSRALDLPCVLILELQRYKDTVRWAALSAEVSGHCQ